MCKIDWCNNKTVAKGYCAKHYYQMKNKGKIVGGSNDPLHYKINNNIAIFKTHAKKYFIADVEDIEKILKLTWSINPSGYVVAYKGRKQIQLGRYLMDYNGKLQVDHININPLDNRKSNLRIVNNMQNQWNTRCKNKHGAKQVYERCGNFGSRITVNGKRIWLGTFETKEEAVNARLKAEKELRGDV